MDSFTESLEDIEREDREWWLKMARWDLESAREQKDYMDVSGDVKNIRSWAESKSLSFVDLGTSEEELTQLVQTGYKSEARMNLEWARDTHGWSRRLHFYVRGVRNVSQCFLKEPNFHDLKWFLHDLKWFLTTIFCPWTWCHTRQHYIAHTREYLAKANLFPSDIGTDEAELVQLGS